MSLSKKLINNEQPVSCAKIPSWEEIIDHMQGEDMSFLGNKVVRVFFSNDRTRRIVILQSDNGFFKTVYEQIQALDEDEWACLCLCNAPDRYPAWWEPVDSTLNNASFYGTEEEANNAILASCEYKMFFSK